MTTPRASLAALLCVMALAGCTADDLQEEPVAGCAAVEALTVRMADDVLEALRTGEEIVFSGDPLSAEDAPGCQEDEVRSILSAAMMPLLEEILVTDEVASAAHRHHIANQVAAILVVLDEEQPPD